VARVVGSGRSDGEKGSGLFGALEGMLAEELSEREIENRMYRLFGRTLAVVVTDTCGFTRATRNGGIVSFLTGLLRVRSMISSIFHDDGCISLRYEADNVYSAFETVEAALRATVRANRSVGEAEVELDGEERFRICAGIGYGRVLWSAEHGAFGDQMNLASKLGEDVACGEEILLTGEAFAQLQEEDSSAFERVEAAVSGVNLVYYRTRTGRL
jgi:class 3 adenylate cyclase